MARIFGAAPTGKRAKTMSPACFEKDLSLFQKDLSLLARVHGLRCYGGAARASDDRPTSGFACPVADDAVEGFVRRAADLIVP